MTINTSKMIAVDIGTVNVKMLKTNSRGIVKSVSMEEWPQLSSIEQDDAKIAAATDALKSCKKNAKIKNGNCVLVLGGPQVVLRQFVWPMITDTQALYDNSESEIASYLSRPVDTYVIDYKVLRQTDKNTQEVLVAAIDRAYVNTIIDACKNVGLTPIKIDLRENVREKLAHADFIWKVTNNNDAVFDPESSYAMVDIGRTLLNVSVFINGTFYINRYLSSSPLKMDDVIAEVGSVVNYASYSGHRAQVSSLIMLREDSESMPRFSAHLSDDLDLPIYSAARKVSKFFDMDIRAKEGPKISRYIDAFAATLNTVNYPLKDLNLIPRKKKRHIFKRIVLPILSTAIALAVAVGAGMYFLTQYYTMLTTQERHLQAQVNALDVSKLNVPQLVAYTNEHRTLAKEHNEFFSQNLDLAAILPEISRQLPEATTISTLTCKDGVVKISGRTTHAEQVAKLENNLKATNLFADVGAEAVQTITENIPSAIEGKPATQAIVVSFIIRIELKPVAQEVVK